MCGLDLSVGIRARCGDFQHERRITGGLILYFLKFRLSEVDGLLEMFAVPLYITEVMSKVRDTLECKRMLRRSGSDFRLPTCRRILYFGSVQRRPTYGSFPRSDNVDDKDLASSSLQPSITPGRIADRLEPLVAAPLAFLHKAQTRGTTRGIGN